MESMGLREHLSQAARPNHNGRGQTMIMRIAGVLVLALLVVGCGTSADPSGSARTTPGPDSPVANTPGSGSVARGGGGRAQRVKPRAGMADVRPVGWDKARQTPSGRFLRITYWSGVE